MENNFNVPVNVKQIGSVSGEGKIYMEDYAYTYLRQYASMEPARERAAFLVGKKTTLEGEQVVFISGVICGKHCIRREGITELTEKSWQYAKKQMELYFNGLDIVGWAYIQPGFEDYLSQGLITFQKNNSQRGLELLYLCDPGENMGSFFRWEQESATFTMVRGYLVYYEKNEGMHEYMLENKLKTLKKTDTATKDEPKDKQPANVDEKLAGALRRDKSRVISEQKRLNSLVGSLSFVMLLVCFIMGAGLVRSDNRLNLMEHQLSLMEQDIKGVQSVFARQEETAAPVTEAATQPTTQAATQAPAPQAAYTATPAQEEGAYRYYTVEKGDTVLKICQNHYGSGAMVEEVLEANNITDPSRLFVGMELKLPKEVN